MLHNVPKLLAIRLIAATAALLAPAACTVRHHTPNAEAFSVQTPAATPESAVPSEAELATSGPQPSSEQIPIDPEDAVTGAPTAPVTLIQFTDLECPFCAIVKPTMTELRRIYGPEQLRIVLKHNPLPFHPHAKRAAFFAQAVLTIGGPEAFFAFVDLAYSDIKNLGEQALMKRAETLGLDARSVAEAANSPAVQQKIARDVQLAARVGATGTPHFFVNGIRISGAQPLAAFTKEIDAELGHAALLRREGVAPGAVYQTRVARNFAAPPAPEQPKPEAADLTVWKIPVTGAPSEGPADALVTIVAFYDYQCPFCKRVQDTIRRLREQYPKDVRIVVRHNPLSFHARARAAATLAVEARAQRGDPAFFEATRRIFESLPALEDSDLLRIAGEMKLNQQRLKLALKNDAHKKLVDADAELASSFEARGTPHFFVNGVRLSGAQPLQSFVAAVDRERAKALALVDKGVARKRVYAEVMKSAEEPPPPERKEIPPPTAGNPSRGPKNAKLLIQVFSDFQCPFCRRVLPTLKEVERRYPGQVRLVWRNLPLAFHAQARPAARAALEARAQQGDAGFWKMHDLLFENQAALLDDELVAMAAKLGLDVTRFKAALADGRHDASIDQDLDIAQRAGINGTPSFVINGYFLSGAQPIAGFTQLTEYALKHPGKPAARPAAPAGKPPAVGTRKIP